MYAEVQYYFEEGGTDYVLLALNRRSEDIAEELSTPSNPQGYIESRRLSAVPISVQYSISENWSVKFVSERQWVYDDGNKAQKTFYNHLLSFSITQSPLFSITFRYEFTSDRGTVDGRKDWTALDASYRLSGNHTITLTLGGDRGGQICTNGVCRIVNPFLGVRASVVSYL
jgi:hypothetical protein